MSGRDRVEVCEDGVRIDPVDLDAPWVMTSEAEEVIRSGSFGGEE